MRSSVYDSVLRRLVEFCEVSHVTGYTDHKASVVFRLLLRLFERFVVNDIYLYVFAAVFEVCLYNSFDYLNALFALDALRVESQIEERAVMEVALVYGSY